MSLFFLSFFCCDGIFASVGPASYVLALFRLNSCNFSHYIFEHMAKHINRYAPGTGSRGPPIIIRLMVILKWATIFLGHTYYQGIHPVVSIAFPISKSPPTPSQPDLDKAFHLENNGKHKLCQYHFAHTPHTMVWQYGKLSPISPGLIHLR